MKFFNCLLILAIIMTVFVAFAPAQGAFNNFWYSVAAPPRKKCAKVGEFCIVSENCCSRLCLPSRRRCVSNFALRPPGQEVDNTIG